MGGRLNKVNFSLSPLWMLQFTEVTPPNNIWRLSQSPPLPMSSFSKQIWVVPMGSWWSPLWILLKFSAIPPFGFSVTTDPPKGINNDRSLMRVAIILQDANMAYHVQRAYKGRPFDIWRGGGGVWVISDKISWRLILSEKKILQGNTCHTIALYVREKNSITRGLGKKNSSANPMKSPILYSA